MEVNTTRPNLPPPASALPQLPLSRLQASLSLSEPARQESAPPTASKFALRTPSKIVKPSISPSLSHPISSPLVPTLHSSPANQSHNEAEDLTPAKEVRRSVSIASFPQPPKVKKTGLDSKYSTATHSLISDATAHSKDGSDSGSGSLRIKRLKSKASADGPGLIYSGSATPTLLDGSGDNKAISGISKMRVSNDIASLRSPPHSRSSSAQGSYSTSATTFEDTDDKRAKEEVHISRGDGSKRSNSGGREHEAKGNVIVSVRVRPDAGGQKSSGKDWLVDSRQSLVAYRGKEGGDYYYGKSLENICTALDPILSANAFDAVGAKVDYLSSFEEHLVVNE